LFKRILVTLSANLTSQIVTILTQLIGIPLYLHFWGESIYGEWLVLMSFPAYLSLAGGGIGNFAGNQMQLMQVKNKPRSALKIFHNAWISTSIISMIFFISIAPLIWFLPINKLININHIPVVEAKMVLLVLFFFGVLCMQSDLLLSVYRADNRNARGVYINSFLRLIEGVTVLVLVALRFKVVAVALVYVLIRTLWIGLIFYDFRKVKWFSMNIKNARFSVSTKEIIPIFSFMAFPLTNAFMMQGMTVLVGIKMGPIAVVSFSVMRTIVNSVKQINSVFYHSVWPEFSSSIAAKDIFTAKKLHRYAFQITLIVCVSFTILFSFLGPTIIDIWTAGKVKMEYGFFLLMLISAVPNNLWTISSVVLISINKHAKLAAFYIAISTFSLMIAVYFIPVLGLIAIPVSLSLTDLCMLYYSLKLSFRVVDDDFKGFSIEVISKNNSQKIVNMLSSLRRKIGPIIKP
jgi:O-antigen/teichoic acid export membrane protein